MSAVRLCAFADEADEAISGQIRALQENGIGMIELRRVDGKNVTELTCGEMKELRKRFDDAGIGVWSIGSPIGKVTVSLPFRPHLELFRHTLELANLSGADRMRIFSFYMEPEQMPEYREEVISRLGQMVEIAKSCGVILCHENEKGIYGDIPQRCVHLHESIPDLRAVYDPANFVQCGADTLQAWEQLEPYIDYMHVKDANREGVVVPAGKGIANVPVLLKRYMAIGGSVVTLEPHLALFAGISELEREEKPSLIGNCFESKREAFDAGVAALKLYI